MAAALTISTEGIRTSGRDGPRLSKEPDAFFSIQSPRHLSRSVRPVGRRLPEFTDLANAVGLGAVRGTARGDLKDYLRLSTHYIVVESTSEFPRSGSESSDRMHSPFHRAGQFAGAQPSREFVHDCRWASTIPFSAGPVHAEIGTSTDGRDGTSVSKDAQECPSIEAPLHEQAATNQRTLDACGMNSTRNFLRVNSWDGRLTSVQDRQGREACSDNRHGGAIEPVGEE
jgi:hypothetical protein